MKTVLKWTCMIVGFTILLFMANSFANFMINNSTAHTEEYTLDIKTPIASLSDSSGTHGSFILGSGSVSNELVFTYYVGTTSFQLKQVPAEYTTIYMDENLKIRHLMAAIESMDGVSMPYSLNIKISGVHKELAELLGRETVV